MVIRGNNYEPGWFRMNALLKDLYANVDKLSNNKRKALAKKKWNKYKRRPLKLWGGVFHSFEEADRRAYYRDGSYRFDFINDFNEDFPLGAFEIYDTFRKLKMGVIDPDRYKTKGPSNFVKVYRSVFNNVFNWKDDNKLLYKIAHKYLSYYAKEVDCQKDKESK